MFSCNLGFWATAHLSSNTAYKYFKNFRTINSYFVVSQSTPMFSLVRQKGLHKHKLQDLITGYIRTNKRLSLVFLSHPASEVPYRVQNQTEIWQGCDILIKWFLGQKNVVLNGGALPQFPLVSGGRCVLLQALVDQPGGAICR